MLSFSSVLVYDLGLQRVCASGWGVVIKILGWMSSEPVDNYGKQLGVVGNWGAEACLVWLPHGLVWLLWPCGWT